MLKYDILRKKNCKSLTNILEIIIFFNLSSEGEFSWLSEGYGLEETIPIDTHVNSKIRLYYFTMQQKFIFSVVFANLKKVDCFNPPPPLRGNENKLLLQSEIKILNQNKC